MELDKAALISMLAVEVRAEAISQKKQKIKGIEINGTDFKLNQCADDKTCTHP